MADVGSGAGLPGLVLAIVRPDLRVTLVEPMARRVAFLEEASLDSDWRGRRGPRRAEQWTHPALHVVTSRAVAALPKLL